MEFTMIVLFVLSSLYQLHFWLIRLDMVNRYERGQQHPQSSPSVSLVVAVKNEEEYLNTHISKWLDQDYPDFELIIVDDNSTDATSQILESFQDGRLKALSLSRELPGEVNVELKGKKNALSYGIEKAKNEWILVTDGDCFPESQNWISSMMSHSNGQELILGYSPYRKTTEVLNKWISYEAWYVAMQYLSAALEGKAYMGVGRNMAFKKEVFHEIGGYHNHMDIRSGDDDLLISSLEGRDSFTVAIEKSAWVWSYAEVSLTGYVNQKRRHLTTAPRYKNKIKFRLILDYLTQLCWYFTSVYLTLINTIWLIVFLPRILIILIVHFRSSKRLENGIHSICAPLFDLLLCGLYFMLSFTYLKPKKDW